MSPSKLALAAAAVLAALPAFASTVVVGRSTIRQCFEAAEMSMKGAREDLAACDQALALAELSRRDRVATHVNRGVLRVRRGDVEGGSADFDAALAINPRVAEAYYNRGVTLLRSDMAAQAVPFFTAAMQRSPDRPALLFYGRGMANERLGNTDAAYADWRQASRLEPEWSRPREEMSRFQPRRN